MKKRAFIRKVSRNVVVALGLAVSVGSQAGMITQVGSGVSFTYDDSSILGTGVVVGNSLTFSPTTLGASASGISATDLASFDLSIKISVLDSSYVVNQLGVYHAGDYVLSGADSSVNASSSLVVDSDLDGISDLTSSFAYSSDFSLKDGLFHEWSALAVEDIERFQSSELELDLSSVLSAETGTSGGLAFIAQKLDQVGLTLELGSKPPVIVSEPSSLLLVSLGLFGLVARKKLRGQN